MLRPGLQPLLCKPAATQGRFGLGENQVGLTRVGARAPFARQVQRQRHAGGRGLFGAFVVVGQFQIGVVQGARTGHGTRLGGRERLLGGLGGGVTGPGLAHGAAQCRERCVRRRRRVADGGVRREHDNQGGGARNRRGARRK